MTAHARSALSRRTVPVVAGVAMIAACAVVFAREPAASSVPAADGGAAPWLVRLDVPAIDRDQAAPGGGAMTAAAQPDAWLRALGQTITGPQAAIAPGVMTALAGALPVGTSGRLGVRSVALTSLRSDASGGRIAWTVSVTGDRAIAEDVFVTTPPSDSAVVRVTRPAGASAVTGRVVVIERGTDVSAIAMTSPAWEPVPDIWAAHDAALARVKPAIVGRRVLDLRVDLSGLRRSAPELFFAPASPDASDSQLGRAHAVLRALGLASGRAASVRATIVAPSDVKLTDPRGVNEIARQGGYAGPALLRLDMTHASRADALEHAAAMSVAGGFYPAELAVLPPRSAPWAMVVRCDLGGPGASEFGAGFVGWTRWLSGVWMASRGAGERADALRRLSAWQTGGGASLRTVAQAAGRWAVAWPLAESGEPAPGAAQASAGQALVVCCPLRTPVNLADVRAAISKLGESIGAEPIPMTPDDRLSAGWTLRRDAGADGSRVAFCATVAVARIEGVEGGALVGVIRVGESGTPAGDASALRAQVGGVRAAGSAASSR